MTTALSLASLTWPLLRLLLLLLSLRHRVVHGVPRNDESDQTEWLYQAWHDAYLLGDVLPPANLTFPAGVPPAPHLEDCVARTRERERQEQRSSSGESPPWARPAPCCHCPPQPPWVRGVEKGNLALTRQVQRDLWEHQFPPGDCSTNRVLVAKWVPRRGHGVGSQLHFMTALLSLAVRNNRTLVVDPGAYPGSLNDDCVEFMKPGEWECYFFSLSSRACISMVEDMKAALAFESCTGDNYDEVAASPDRVVCLNYPSPGGMTYESHAASRWGSAYLESPCDWEINGRLFATDDDQRRTHWWRAQAVRFMLRWPSEYLCHVMNKQRHVTYGSIVAQHVAAFLHTHSQLADLGANLSLPAVNLSSSAATPPGWHGCVWTGILRAAEGGENETVGDGCEGVGGEPYMVRPMVSLHVRMTDKVGEMKLTSFNTYMLHVNRLRTHLPDLNYIWINTESDAVLEEAGRYRGWVFLRTTNARLQVGEAQRRRYEWVQNVGLSFVGALLAAESDAFVGSLGSNWSRLINELRSTNGRLLSGYISMNHLEW